MIDYSIELINDQKKLVRLINHLASIPVIALDIETTDWWNRRMERIALIQLAFKTERQPKVAIIDALAELDFEVLRSPLESNTTTKVIHNAVFDASRLAAHFGFNVAPIHDTMVAARRSGERRYSLKAQAETHLNLQLDKERQTSNWSRRPLSTKQIHYAALDAFSTLLLYEDQLKRKLNGSFQLKDTLPSSQATLPLTEFPESNISPVAQEAKPVIEEKRSQLKIDLPTSSIALLGIITELPSRYHPDQLTVSVGSERVGLAGWIVDRMLGSDVDFDEETAKLGIADLCEQGLVRITETRRLEATTEGEQLWCQLKSI
ncbi:MAG TPA: ribonuclease D [Pyrinomonadaceae bacterium]|nr:ribonuclease D [Pyrinomonadaceae bacterium]